MLLRNLLKALIVTEKHTLDNAKFDATFSETLHQQWLVMIQKWEHDKSNSNPYTHKEKGTSLTCYDLSRAHTSTANSLAEVRRKLAEADEKAVREGSALQQASVAGSVFIRNGLEIEEHQ